jgi:lipopolysaccharide/colanic/teichoic acid biosynthesis glycosyltransferase
MKVYENHVKRLLDVLLASIALIVFFPVIAVVSALVRLKLGSPVFFSQDRPGKNEKPIKVYKFRSMTNEKDSDGCLLPDEVRLTSFGKKLRSTSLDELPQLFSILKGDMSIIGPRPQSYENVAFMDRQQRKRHSVTPGLTGWAQVNGRNAIDWGKKLEYDLEYVDNISFGLDFKIFFKTVYIVLKRKDVTLQGHATTETFGEYLLRTNQLSQDNYERVWAETRKLGT